MEEKYIKFYKTFHKKFKNDKNLIHCLYLLSDGGVISNSALKRKYYGRFSSNGFCFRDGWCSSIGSSGKINKDLETKGNSRRGLQRRVMHCSKSLCYCWKKIFLVGQKKLKTFKNKTYTKVLKTFRIMWWKIYYQNMVNIFGICHLL